MGPDIFEVVVKLINKLSAKYTKDLEFYLAFMAKTKGKEYADYVRLHSFESKFSSSFVVVPSKGIQGFHYLLRMMNLVETIKNNEYDNLTRMIYSKDHNDTYLALKIVEKKYKEYDKFTKTPEGEEKLYKILDDYYVDVVKFVNDKLLKDDRRSISGTRF
jgi:hypothetical protein